MFDWRTRFHLPLSALFTGEMSWAEAISLTRGLMSDPSSHVATAFLRWEHPMSREAFILADVHDRITQAHFKNPKPYPRPTDRNVGRSKRPTISQAAVRAELARRGHTMN